MIRFPSRPWPRPGPLTARLVAVTAGTVAVACLVAVTVHDALPPTLDDLRGQAGWSAPDTLTVEVADDVPGIGQRQPDGSYAGFDVEIALLVAGWLGVPSYRVRFRPVRMAADGSGPVPADPPADLILDAAPMAASGASGSSGSAIGADTALGTGLTAPGEGAGPGDGALPVAGPYLTTENSVLVRAGHASLESLSALAEPLEQAEPGARRAGAQRVCTVAGSTGGAAVRSQAASATLVSEPRSTDCVRRLDAGEVDVVVADAALLAGTAVARRELKLCNVTAVQDDSWGIRIGPGPVPGRSRARSRARQHLVALALDRLGHPASASPWDRAFDATLATVQQALPSPGMFPQLVANPRHPPVQDLPAVLELPWQRWRDDGE